MKILLINNFHYLRGGAERAYFDLAEILQKNGHQVAFFSTNHPQTEKNPYQSYFVDYYELGDPSNISLWQKFKTASRMFYKWETRRKLKKLIRDFRPDIAHLHNIFYHLTPAVISELKENKIPMVMTLHDFRSVSSNHVLATTTGEIWEKDKDGNHWRGFWEKCHKNSYLQSLLAVLEVYFHKLGKFLNQVDVFIAPSKFLIKKYREFGFDKKILHLPNPILPEAVDEVVKMEFSEKVDLNDGILFFGRLSPEKGVGVLLEAYSNLNISHKLIIAGDGPEKNSLMKKVAEKGLGDKVIFTGRLTHGQLFEVIKKAKIVVCPSICYENAPYSVLEAMKLGRVVVASRLGGQKELIKDGVNGFLFESKNALDLEKVLRKALKNEKLMELVGVKAADYVTENNNREHFYSQLLEIYQGIGCNNTDNSNKN